MNSDRGIVISTPVVARPHELQISSGPLDSQELRYWLLFWDKLNFPLLDAIQLDPGSDGDFLIETGILNRHHVSNVNITMPMDGSSEKSEQTFQYHFLRAFREIDELEPGVWSLATGENSLAIDEQENGEGRGVLFRLHRALPVPNKDVPLADILNFKEHRRDELLSLRCNLEETYQKIAGAPDQELALNTEFSRLDVSLSEFLKVSQESKLKSWRMTNIGIEFSIKRGVNTAVVAYSQSLSLVSSALTGLTASVDIGAGFGLRGLNRENSNPWKYVTSYHERIF